MKDIKTIISENLVSLRVKHKLTQSALAEKLNYTDKAISKWECGDTLPPIDVLKNITDLYGVSLDYLVSETPDNNYDKRYNYKENNANKAIITLLATLSIWMIATFIYIYSFIFYNYSVWIVFIGATPLSCLILLIFNGIWGKRSFTFILISCLIWSLLATAYCMLLAYNNFWSIFILGVPFQIAIILWSKLKRVEKIRQKH